MDGYQAARRAAEEANRRATEAGMDRADRGAKVWRPFIRETIRCVARRQAVFTVDDVRELMADFVPMNPPPFNLMAIGPGIYKLLREGEIERMLAPAKGRSPSHHGSRTQFRSLLYGQGQIRLPGIDP